MATRCCCPPDSREGYSSRLSDRPTQSKSSSALTVASALDMPLTVTGASMMLPRAVMWGKRLNCWKTMPAFWRMLADVAAVLAGRLPGLDLHIVDLDGPR